jgi:hypothetical protein
LPSGHNLFAVYLSVEALAAVAFMWKNSVIEGVKTIRISRYSLPLLRTICELEKVMKSGKKVERGV